MNSKVEVTLASDADIPRVLALVAAFHAEQRIVADAHGRAAAVERLIEDERAGRLWLIDVDHEIVGYIAVCFGFSIEFGGMDAFVDEFYIVPHLRGRGIGSQVLERVKEAVRSTGVKALHLEVLRTDEDTQRLYRRAGFAPREKYMLMSAPIS